MTISKMTHRTKTALLILENHFIDNFSSCSESQKILNTKFNLVENDSNKQIYKHYKKHVKHYVEHECCFNDGDLFEQLNQKGIRTGLLLMQKITAQIRKTYIKKSYKIYPKYETWINLKLEASFINFG